jgi:hypothetical protein
MTPTFPRSGVSGHAGVPLYSYVLRHHMEPMMGIEPAYSVWKNVFPAPNGRAIRPGQPACWRTPNNKGTCDSRPYTRRLPGPVWRRWCAGGWDCAPESAPSRRRAGAPVGNSTLADSHALSRSVVYKARTSLTSVSPHPTIDVDRKDNLRRSPVAPHAGSHP